MPASREDKLYKVPSVYNLIVERWRSLYNLGEFISIDEGMLKWRGKLSFRVYSKDKPIKCGIKSYILADSHSRYCWNIAMYHGVSKPLIETVTGLLTPQCMSRWHTLYMDNFYNSVAICSNARYTLSARPKATVANLKKFVMHAEWGRAMSLPATTARYSCWPGKIGEWSK